MSAIQLVVLHTNQVLVLDCESEPPSNWAPWMPGVPINFQKAAQCFVCFIILCWAKISFSNTVEILHNLFPTSPKSQWGRGKFRNGAAAYEHFKVGILKRYLRPFLCNCFVYKLGPVNTGCKSTEVVLLTYTNRRGKGKLHRTDLINTKSLLNLQPCWIIRLMLPLLLIDVIIF